MSSRVSTVVFDVGETLLDETGLWTRAAAAAGVPAFTLMGVLGGLAARGEHHSRAWEILGTERVASEWEDDDWYPDAAPCLERLRAAGYRVCAVGNTPASSEAHIGSRLEVLGSSERWGVEKPSPAFFERVVDTLGTRPERIAYVGDRVDNDVVPALAAGMVAVHIRRGPWGFLHEPPAGAVRIRSLDELPGALPA